MSIDEALVVDPEDSIRQHFGVQKKRKKKEEEKEKNNVNEDKQR